MSLYNDLSETRFTEMTSEELEGVQHRAEEAANNIRLGVSAIGNLMFWAAENENYSGNMAKSDMYLLGAMLTTINDVWRALDDTANNALFSKKKTKM